MLHITFQVFQAKGSEGDFECFSMYFYASNPGPSFAGHFRP